MKTVETVIHQMTDTRSIMQDLRDTLRAIDPAFPETEDRFLRASADLERELEGVISPSVSEFLAAKEEVFVTGLIYIGWQGFQLNLDIFENPVNALLLRGDYEDLHRERRLWTLPTAEKARDVETAFYAALKDLPDEKRDLTKGVTEFYSYLKTAGFKLVHYFGFRLADRFLPYVIPGYTSDPANTFQYSQELTRYLQMDLDRME